MTKATMEGENRLSDLVKWFEKRREDKALAIVQRHLILTTTIAGDLEKAITAAIEGHEKEKRRFTETVADGEREADKLRRKVMHEISKGELSPTDREDLMELVKRVDMIADWSRESTRILAGLSMEHVPPTIKECLLEMARGAKECVESLQKCMNKMLTRPDEALQAADEVEREEEKVDDIHEKARVLLGKEDLPKAGVAVLISQLFEAIEMIADSCEDACDQVRIIMVRK
jgi:predicted phosphate transport protein (TIGR00153 family)